MKTTVSVRHSLIHQTGQKPFHSSHNDVHDEITSYPRVPRPAKGGLGGFCVGGLVLERVPPLIDGLLPCCWLDKQNICLRIWTEPDHQIIEIRLKKWRWVEGFTRQNYTFQPKVQFATAKNGPRSWNFCKCMNNLPVKLISSRVTVLLLNMCVLKNPNQSWIVLHIKVVIIILLKIKNRTSTKKIN